MSWLHRKSARNTLSLCTILILPWLVGCPPESEEDTTGDTTNDTSTTESNETTEANETSETSEATTETTETSETTDETSETTDETSETTDGTDSDSETDTETGTDTGLEDVCNYAPFDFPEIPLRELTVIDLDGDENMDIVGKWYPFGEVLGSTQTFYYGDSSGQVFTPGESVEVDHWSKMFSGDFNGDGWADLVHHINQGDLLTQLNAEGVLEAPVEESLMTLFYERIVQDIDGDGQDDLTYGGYYDMPARLALSNGDGTFTETGSFSVFACYVTAGEWADYDGNGELDFAVIGECNSAIETPKISVHLQVNGNFSLVPTMPVAHAVDTSEMVAGHFNDDGIIDLAVAGRQWDNNPTIEIFYGNGDGTFAAPIVESFEMGTLAKLGPANVHDDGLQDLFVTAGTSVQLLVNDGGDGFTRCVLSADDVEERQRHVGDLNHDGIPDLVTTYGAETPVMRVWLSQN
ncbi:MAG: FG-GAP repeat domain-containing protein [Nannocystaceae bacterium]